MAQNTEKWGKAAAKERYGAAKGSLNDNPKANNLQAPQDVQDQHSPAYDNCASGWVRGNGKPHPNFDKGREGKN